LVALEYRAGGGEECARIQFIVSQELERATVKLVGARFGDRRNGRTAAPEGGAVLTGGYRELLQGVRVRIGVGDIVERVHIESAVQRKIHVDRAPAGSAERGLHRSPLAARGERNHSGREAHQLQRIAAVERQLLDSLRIHQVGNRTRGRSNRRRDSAYFDTFAHCAYL